MATTGGKCPEMPTPARSFARDQLWSHSGLIRRSSFIQANYSPVERGESALLLGSQLSEIGPARTPRGRCRLRWSEPDEVVASARLSDLTAEGYRAL